MTKSNSITFITHQHRFTILIREFCRYSPSVMFCYCVKMVACIITHTHILSNFFHHVTLVVRVKSVLQKSDGNTVNGSVKQRWVWKKLQFSTNIITHLGNNKDRPMVIMDCQYEGSTELCHFRWPELLLKAGCHGPKFGSPYVNKNHLTYSYYYYRVLRAICCQPVDGSLICFM